MGEKEAESVAHDARQGTRVYMGVAMSLQLTCLSAARKISSHWSTTITPACNLLRAKQRSMFEGEGLAFGQAAERA
jgi:hypothetical protein